ncbi:MAG: hypothetical protein COS76_00560 [Candidatus Portnoybacteria bacterium CG06_land_8_20_14_3_00_39_12]|uniref:Uncharacterized protein n=1 Tax=Candidatus Portnoybacteria bacterium CG06_land_8_20_14_3_00_39_12 TaxID=1974809 RepID=A0A2M7AXX0_9BACT|nr:MAG: hypothetical protein COS76_00560 [Candidatus Portnoybacteria bacterium CG06_land_8_20_14_3_00_39_12]
MTIEIPLYQNKKGEMVPWEKLTEEEKREENKKSRIMWLNPPEIKENISEIIDLLSKTTSLSRSEVKQEIEKILQENQ